MAPHQVHGRTEASGMGTRAAVILQGSHAISAHVGHKLLTRTGKEQAGKHKPYPLNEDIPWGCAVARLFKEKHGQLAVQRTLFPATSACSMASHASTIASVTLAAVAPGAAAACAASALSCCSAIARFTAVGRLLVAKLSVRRLAVAAAFCSTWTHYSHLTFT